MVYLVYGDQSPMIKKRIKTIVKEVLTEKDDMNYVVFDAEQTPIQDIMDEVNYLPLGYEQKVVVIENAYFLLKKKPKEKIESEQDYRPFYNFIRFPSDFAHLIISINQKDVDEKSDIYLAIKENGKIFVASTPDKENWQIYVKRYLVERLNVKIDNDALNELATRTEGDIALFQSNAEKLAIYTNHITYDDVLLMVPQRLDDNTFAIYNYLLNNRNDEAIRLYRSLVNEGVEPVTLISTLANQFRLLNEVSYLSSTGMNDEQIGEELRIKPIRAKIIRKQIFQISSSTIRKTLKSLFELDKQIKSGQVDRFYAFELFLIKFKAE